MLRFLVKQKTIDQIGRVEMTSWHTLDAEVPEVEAILRGGGFGESGCDVRHVIGVEIRDSKND